jgi:hypothetical protein
MSSLSGLYTITADVITADVITDNNLLIQQGDISMCNVMSCNELIVGGISFNNGSLPQFEIGTVESTPYGNNPEVSLTNVGETYTLNFVLETGKNGTNGRNGSDGRDGRDGSDGRDGKDGTDGAIIGGVALTAVVASVAVIEGQMAVMQGEITGLLATTAGLSGVVASIEGNLGTINAELADNSINIATLQTKTQNQTGSIGSTSFDGTLGCSGTFNVNGNLTVDIGGTLFNPKINTSVIESTNNNASNFNPSTISLIDTMNVGNALDCLAINVGNTNSTTTILGTTDMSMCNVNSIEMNNGECYGTLTSNQFQSNNYGFRDTISGQTMNIGTNASSGLLTPNYIYIGSGFDIITIQGNLIFTTPQGSNYIKVNGFFDAWG